MTVYRVEAPDGSILRIEGPEGAAPEKLQEVARTQYMQGIKESQAQKEATRSAIENDPISQGARKFAANDMTGAGRLRAGVGRGLTELARGAGQFVGTLDQKDVGEARKLDAPLLATPAGALGNIGGQVAASFGPGMALRGAGMAAGAAGAGRLATALSSAGRGLTAPDTFKSGLASGATLGGLMPYESSQEAITNMVGGAAGSGLASALAKTVRPNISPEVRLLREEGVVPTPGQILGGMANRTEEKLQSVPILGDAITYARRGAVEGLNRAALQRTLEPIGETLASRGGREAVDEVYQKLGNAYTQALTGLNIRPDAIFERELGTIRQMTATLPQAQAEQFERILQSKVLRPDLMTPLGTMSGETMKTMESELGRLARGYRSSPDFDVRQLSDAVEATQKALRDTVARSHPDTAERIQAINRGYSNFARVRDAASRPGATDGVFSPAQLSSAVRGADHSVGHGSFARGAAPMQDLSDAGLSVLGPKYPDSGTTGRLLMGGGALGSGMIEPMIPLGLGAASIPYLPGANRLAAALLAGERPQAVQALNPLLRYAGPGAATLPAALAGMPATQ